MTPDHTDILAEKQRLLRRILFLLIHLEELTGETITRLDVTHPHPDDPKRMALRLHVAEKEPPA